MEALVFIDTNILLDFYRGVGREGGLAILDHLDGNHHRIITGSQVEMEFKKHRQRVIIDAYRSLVVPDKGRLALPAFLAESKQAGAISKNQAKLQDLLKTLKERTSRILNRPQQYDIVYRCTQRLFRSDSPHNLSRNKKERLQIRRQAWKRFILGYPPRKADDTSLGDAINWEWMVSCARSASKELVIVSRDSDYGVSFDRLHQVNDWLAQEFRERVSKKRKVTLTDRLTEGLKAAGIKVTKKEEQEEARLLDELPARPTSPGSSSIGHFDMESYVESVMGAGYSARLKEFTRLVTEANRVLLEAKAPEPKKTESEDGATDD